MYIKWNPCVLFVGMNIGPTTVEISTDVSKKLKIKTVLRFCNFTPEYVCMYGYISEENRNTSSKRYMHFNAHSNIVYNCQDMEETCLHQ